MEAKHTHTLFEQQFFYPPLPCTTSSTSSPDSMSGDSTATFIRVDELNSPIQFPSLVAIGFKHFEKNDLSTDALPTGSDQQTVTICVG